MAQITVRNLNNRTLTVNPALTLLQLFQREEIPIPTRCGGHARCGYCRISFLSGLERAAPRTESEEIFRREHGLPEHVRLACQTVLAGDAEIMIGEHPLPPT